MTRIGVIGAGQLGQMLGIAGQRMGLEFIFLDPADDPPAARVGSVLKYPFDGDEGLALLAAATEIITYEFENVPVAAIERIADGVSVYPPAQALLYAQDRVAEKTLFEFLGIPVPGFRPVNSSSELLKAIEEIGLPLVLKTRRLGYDGKGQFVIRNASEIDAAIAALGVKDLIAEQWVRFDREISAIGVRSRSGQIVHYPLTGNEHESGILRISRAPAILPKLQETAQSYVTTLLEHLDYVGVLALELFVTGDRLLANEFAPRVHNSGHWTIEGAKTSQFENHLRAILDMPLGETAMCGYAGMLNLIGNLPVDRNPFESHPCHLHDYGKVPRPGRKLGHATVVTTTAEERDATVLRLSELLST
ncbi:MAG: 5-(carboxyamino)imidazole ribonucleotide synthase [Proteobacteria bacterium]|nr:5-(carboxyamino)imidazole ribonucleotide synthase [Pseudomonadota bacterium]MDA0992480.1 5-(carboxyamino)imidazole ribonucleotide synthase [Pseudomonadota bacterium]